MLTRTVQLSNGTVMRVAAAMERGDGQTRFALVATIADPPAKPREALSPADAAPAAPNRVVLRARKTAPPPQPMLPLFALLRQKTPPAAAPRSAVIPAPSAVQPAASNDAYEAPFLLGPIAR
jgi:hypothetical protein